MMRRDYAEGTYLECDDYVYGYVNGRAMCPDGKVRMLKRILPYAETFFSIPASVAVKGRTVSGYVMISTVDGEPLVYADDDDDEKLVTFRPYLYGKNANVFDKD